MSVAHEEPGVAAEHTEIAIIGMAGRFPGARTVEEFWANVRDGVESIRTLSDDELLAAGVSRAELADPDYVKACPVLADVDKFDAGFFGFSPRDASVMDPAHRFFLEVAWQAIEHAGYTALPEEGAVGVFAGSGAPLYMIENVRTNPQLMRSMGEFLVRHTGNDMNFLTTRVSYELDLRGPSINVQTACSSALVSLHMACQSLVQGDCVLALAGGSTILVPNGRGYLYKEGEIMSPDGHCRPFDENSAGTVFGSGTGCVVLKRLQDALDDGDTIHAVIKGSAINNDGAVKVGYLAPGVDGQAAVIDRALAVARVSADSVSYVETHGTGTLVGDPIEVEALNQAFRAHTDKRKFCAIGSVKSNIGHLGEAAATASLIKAIMALKHRQLPPSLGYHRPNPAIDFDDSPFFVNQRLRDWQSKGPRRCGITALGAGGTNCHVILEEAPERIAGEGARARQLLVLSAKTRTALDTASDNLADALEADASIDLADAAYTLSLGRRAMPHRRVLAVESRSDAIARLRTRDPKQVVTQRVDERELPVVFMFPGGGAQYARMGAELYELEDVYRDAVDACLALIEPELGRDLRSLMFAPPAEAERATRTLEQPSLTLPSLFTTSYALTKLFVSWGVAPSAFVGHSMGEYVAACLAGVVSLHDALRLVMLRGRLFEVVELGGMLSVPLSEAELRTLMTADLSIAAVNAPELSVASGPAQSIDALQARLLARDIESTRIRIDVAAHSAMLDPILAEFRALCRTISFRPPQVPFVSNLTGRWITPGQATDPEYWVQHLRSTVRFADCVKTVLASGERALLEVGPGRTLSMLVRAQLEPAKHAFNSMRHPQEAASDLEYGLTTLGRLWAAGVALDWSAFYDGQLRNRIPLPTYPFEHQSFWVEAGRAAPRVDPSELTKRSDLSEWFYGLQWEQAPLLERAAESATRRWLVFAHDRGQGRELARALEQTGAERVILLTPGGQLVQEGPSAWRLDVRSPEQYVELLQTLDDCGETFEHAVYLVGGSRKLPPVYGLPRFEAEQSLHQNFLSLTYLARALGGLAEPLQLSVVTSGLAGFGGQRIEAQRALALGPVYVTPHEFAQVQARCIDLPPRLALGAGKRELLQQLLRELRAEGRDRLVALRPGERWVQRVAALPLPPRVDATARPWLREDGVYLITGGLGGIGLEVAQHLADSKRVKLALLARSELPDESQWEAVLSEAEAGSEASGLVAQRIRKVRALRAGGAHVLVVAADVTDAASMRAALARVRATLGPLRGVVHAAGSLDDEPMQSKTASSMRRVLAPKVQGTVLLDSLIDEPLDFFVLFSSVASFLGLPGQVDYTAANAFLDAFARERSQRAQGRTTVVNWNAWREVGMAAAAHRAQTTGVTPVSLSVHPALDGYSDTAGGRLFVTDFSIARHWLLSEHRIKGSFALLPGTSFVELSRAVFSAVHPGERVELTNLTFLSPFQVADGETRRLSVQLSPMGESTEITMRSGSDLRGPSHVVSMARAYTGPAPRELDLAAILQRCQLRDETPRDGFLKQDFVAFGPRWANIAKASFGASEALLELRLAAPFVDDLAGYVLHPAVLDMATGAAQALIPGVKLESDFYVPMSYGSVIVLGRMPAHSFSHVRVLPDSGAGLAHFDVTLCDATGHVYAEISRFTMKKLDARSAMTAAESKVAPRAETRRNETMEALLREAITPREGVEALDRIMAQPHLVQAIASSVDVLRWQSQLDEISAPQPSESADDELTGFSRPELANDYEPPSSATEIALSQIWSELLGVRQVGVHDDFFDLGGNSLVAVRLFAAVKKRFRASLPLATLFEAPTIRALATLLDAGASPADAPPTPSAPVVAAKADETEMSVQLGEERESNGYSPLVPIQLGSTVPFFCVHGAGGNVLNFRYLAKRLGDEQTFYGLQAKGLNGGAPAATIEEMAIPYIEAIRKVRPYGPYLLAGYSGGGVVAYEMAQRLSAAGERVSLLAFLDTFHPAVRPRAPAPSERFEQFLAEGAPYVSRTARAKLTRKLDQLSSELKIRFFQGKGDRLPLELLDLHITRAFDEASWIYQPKRYDGPVTLYRARTIAPSFAHAGPQLGWHDLVPRLDIVEVPGSHQTLLSEPNVQMLVAHLKRLIAAASH